MIVILKQYLYQLIFSIGIIILTALLIWIIVKLWYRLLGDKARGVCIATGLIGTPIHETGHLLMCLLFGHKVHEVKFFMPRSDDGVLGYVSHSYNKRNLYHQLGNFFIGVGPIFFGAAIMIGLLYLLVPHTAGKIGDIMGSLASSSQGFTSMRGIGDMFMALGNIFVALFSPYNFGDWRWWIFIIICSQVAMHMCLSPPDIKCSIIGALLFMGILFIINLVVGTISKVALSSMTGGIMIGSAYIISIMSISLILSLVILAVTGVIWAISKLLSRIKFSRS